jgi:ADP-heptose:LPS heptosyltransferase
MAEWEGSSILVIRLSSLGDIARLLPSLRALKNSSAERVDLTIEDRFEPLLRLFPIPDHVIAYPRRKAGSPLRRPVPWVSAYARYVRSLRSARYDLALDMHGILRSAVVGQLSGATHTAGFGPRYGKENSHLLYETAVFPGPTPVLSRYDRYAGTLAALGFPAPAMDYLAPEVPPEARRDVEDFLDGSGLQSSPYLFAFLGASKAQKEKRWPAFRFIETARRVWDELGLETVIGWGPEESDLVRSLDGEPHVRFIPDWGIDRLLEVIRRARAFVGADTGAMHLAALMGVPTLALLGPTDPLINRPFGSRSRILHRPGIDRPCEGADCLHDRCMAAIEPTMVVRQLSELLEET